MCAITSGRFLIFCYTVYALSFCEGEEMRFLFDYNGGLNLSDNDLMESFQLTPIDPTWLHEGTYSCPPTSNLPKFIVHFDIVL